MRHYFTLFLLIILAACGQHMTAEANFCEALINDVFMPQHKLDIKSVTAEKTDGQNLVHVEYSINDIMDKRIQDRATCTFDVAAETPILTGLKQFNNDVPEKYVSFLNARITRLINNEKTDAAPQESKADIQDIIPGSKPTTKPAAEETKPQN